MGLFSPSNRGAHSSTPKALTNAERNAVRNLGQQSDKATRRARKLRSAGDAAGAREAQDRAARINKAIGEYTR